MVAQIKIVRQKDTGKTKTTEEETRTLCTLIDGFAAHDKEVAIVSFSRNASATLTFKAFTDEIIHMAAGLQAHGIKKGDNIAFFAPNSPAWIISALAVIYSGATVVPIDSQQSDEVLKHIVKDSLAGWIFTDERGSKRLDKALPKSNAHAKTSHRIVRLDKEDIPDSWKNVSAGNGKKKSNEGNDKQESSEGIAKTNSSKGNHTHPTGNGHKTAVKSNSASPAVVASDIAVLFYTSGTTGVPKGVPLSHTNMMLQLDSISKMDLLKPSDRVLAPLPLFHVYPLNIGLLVPLTMGLPVVLPHSLTGPEIMRAINEGKVTVIVGVPRLLRTLFLAIENRLNENKIVGAGFAMALAYCQTMDRLFGLRPGRMLFAPLRKKFAATLRLFTCGGAPLDAELASKLRAIGWEIAVGYGLTETSPLLSLRLPENRDLQGVGEPIKGVEVKIQPLKERDEQIDKDAGEIIARGPNVFAGYRNRPELDKEVFTGDGWFKTGDLGVFKNSQLHVIGRASSTIVMEGGEKIQPEDVEDKIAKQPGISEIGLLQVEHKLVALIVPDMKALGDKDLQTSIASAVKAASAGLASYLQITDFAITRDALPRTNLGKIKRHELTERYEQAKKSGKDGKGGDNGKDGKSKAPSPGLDSADQTLIEEPAAASCWEWLKAKFPDQEVTLDTNPQLDLNIDSLEWMNLTLELAEKTGVEISGEAISRATTVRELLNEVVSSAEGGEEAVSPLEDPDHYLSDKQREFLKPLQGGRITAARMLYFFTVALMKPFRVTAVGSEHLSDKQFVLVPNHASYIDAFALTAVLPYDVMRNTHWAGWSGIAFGNPIFSFLSRIAQVFPIEAKQSLFASLALAVSVLKAGNNLVWFPEGERTLDGKLLPFKQGIGLLLEKSDVSVVPVYLNGTREALPPGAFFPSFHQIKVIFGEPVKAKQLAKEGKGKEAPERIANALHDRVEALSKA
jgi:long-chain acyl-CoA synthetase